MESENFARCCSGTPHCAADREETQQLGNNLLANAESYVFATGHGRDSIVINGLALSSGKKLAESDSVWWDATEKFRIARVTDNQLLITPTAGGDSVTVKNWKPGDLGLALGEEAEKQEEPAPSTLYLGDQRAPRYGIEIRNGEIETTDPSYGSYDGSVVTWQLRGALLGGYPATDFSQLVDAYRPSPSLNQFLTVI